MAWTKKDDAARKKVVYWERKNAGLCVSCGEPRKRDGTSTECRPCAAKSNKAQWARMAPVRQAKKALGLCRDCDNEAVEGRAHCAYHAEMHDTATATWRKKNRLEGRCACGKEPRQGMATCEACAAAFARRKRRHRLNKALKQQGLALARIKVVA